MSFFAFTATPKFKTLELFGHRGPDGKPAPFHLYSMRQAIEEGFILDVLAGYTTYQRFFQLNRAVAADPLLDKKKAAAALSRFVNLQPTNIAQKTAIIIEHFRSCVLHQLGGRAKAMVVTSSRLMAVKYKLAFDRYIAEQGYTDVRCLVAFSGEVRDDALPAFSYAEARRDPDRDGYLWGAGVSDARSGLAVGVRDAGPLLTAYTESGMNQGVKETELPERFASDAYQVLIVANKYQTGFDQPLLCAMYVDKRLAGIQAVQTLSRLNRTYPGKEQTFVLDFVNEREEILASFRDYYETTTTAEEVDPQRLYELQHALDEVQIYTAPEVDAFAAVFFKLRSDKHLADNAKLNGWINPAVDRFKALATGADDDDGAERQDDFRGKLSAFLNLYGFLAQFVPFQDPDLEKRYAFGRMLRSKLPRPETGGVFDLGDDVALVSFKLKLAGEGSLELQKGEGGELPGPTETGTGAVLVQQEKLSAIIELMNERFGIQFDAQDLVDGVTTQLIEDEDLQQAARANDKDNFAVPFREALDDALIGRHEKHHEFINRVFEDEVLGGFFRVLMLDAVYEKLQGREAAVR